MEVRDIRKVYGGTAALKGVDMRVEQGEIHALLGENGAGKSTLVRILAGLEDEDAGRIQLLGHDVSGHRTPAQVSALGAAFIHQDLALVETMSVCDNIALYAGFRTRRGLISGTDMRARAADALSRIGLDIPVDAMVAELSIAEQAVVAIARALAIDARLIVLDEPTASLTLSEARALFRMLRNLRDEGVGCILITHRTDEVPAVCDRVTVFRDGLRVITTAVQDVTKDDLTAWIVGESVETARAPDSRTAPGSVRLRLENVNGEGVGPLSIDFRAGEVTCVTGLADAGHLALAELLFGVQSVLTGKMTLDDEAYEPRGAWDATRRGVAFVPSDRAAAGLAMNMSARENLFMNPDQHGLRAVVPARERAEALSLMNTFDVRPRAPEAELTTFSGGNAQKLLLAKWLSRRPAVVVLSEPTSGVDVGARSHIYASLRDASAAGACVIVASSDFEEVEQLADRAVVMRRGSITSVMNRSEIAVSTLTGAAYAS